MTAQPVGPTDSHDPGYDPGAIFTALPGRLRAVFKAEYDAALDAAHDFARYKQIREVLHLWRMRAVAHSHPGYEAGIQAALERQDDQFVGADQIPGWEGRL